jgi:hypothetical protein
MRRNQTFNYNAMETLYLCTALFILLAGMAFQSGVTVEGSGPHAALTWVVALVLVTCVAIFMVMLAMEVFRSYRFARRVARAAKSRRGTLGAQSARPVAHTSRITTTGSVASKAIAVSTAAAASSGMNAAPVSSSNRSAWTTNPLRVVGAGVAGGGGVAPPPLPPPPPPPPAAGATASSPAAVPVPAGAACRGVQSPMVARFVDRAVDQAEGLGHAGSVEQGTHMHVAPNDSQSATTRRVCFERVRTTTQPLLKACSSPLPVSSLCPGGLSLLGLVSQEMRWQRG